jgi:probable HAF family extracellular repeat protein
MKRSGTLVAAALALSLPLAAGSLSAQEYELVELGTLGGSTSQALGITQSGRVLGWATTPQSVKHPVYWDEGGIVDLGSPPGFIVGEAVAGNDAGQVAVTGEGSPQSYEAFRWESAAWTPLGVLLGRDEAIPADLDASGRVVGMSLTLGGGNTAAFLWEGGGMTNLGTLGGTTARAYGINGSRQVVGWARLPEVAGVEDTRAFLWEDDVMTDLGKLPDRDHSQALAINDNGDVVGSSWVVTSPNFFSADRATLWRSTGEIVDLGRTPGPEACVSGLPFWTDNVARAVNNQGQIVGDAQCVASGGARAGFLWQDGVMHNLEDLIPADTGWEILAARGINDAGQIVGFGITPGGDLQAYRLDPVTETSAPVAAATGRLELAASPSPFRASTRISFSLPEAASVRLTLHDVTGRRVAELANGRRPAGRHEVEWTAPGESVAPGVYFVRLEAAGRAGTAKIVRVR